jgi:hypothetical protein
LIAQKELIANCSMIPKSPGLPLMKWSGQDWGFSDIYFAERRS